MQPRKVREALEGRFPAEIILEVFFAIDDYARFWDERHSGEGFDISHLSPPAQGAFAMVLDIIEKYNADYYRRNAAQSNNAKIGADKRNETKRKAKRQTTYYETKKDEINRKRREAYKLKKERENRLTGECQTKPDDYLQGVKRKTSDESHQPQSSQEIAENPAMADRITDYCNSSLRSELLDWKEGMGENQVINNEVVDNLDESSSVASSAASPTNGLSGSKAVQTGRIDPVCSKAVGGHPAAVRGSPQGAGSKGKLAVEDTLTQAASLAGDVPLEGDSKAVSGGETPPPSSARNDCAAPPAAKPKPKPWLSAPHKPGPDEVQITKNFKIDFTDPIFKPYHRADSFVVRGLEGWLIENKLGCSVEKKWLCRQLVAFHRNQGKLSVLMGVDPPD